MTPRRDVAEVENEARVRVEVARLDAESVSRAASRLGKIGGYGRVLKTTREQRIVWARKARAAQLGKG